MSVAASSILWRIVIRLSITTLIAILISYSWLWLTYRSVTEVMRDRMLTEFVGGLAKELRQNDLGEFELAIPPAAKAVYANTRDNDLRFSVRDRRTGEVLAQEGGETGPIPPLGSPNTRLPALYQYNPDGPGPVRMFGAALATKLGDRPLVIQVEESARDMDAITQELVHRFAAEGGWLGVPFLLAMLVVSLVTIRDSLAPLKQLSTQAAAIGPGSTEIRLPEGGVPREILPLVHAVNSALDRIENGFRTQREFAADAAHELRTPLAVLRAQLETLPDPAFRDTLLRDLDAMTRLISQLLAVARAEAITLGPDDQADLNAIAVEVGTFLVPMAVRQGRLIEVLEAPACQPLTGNGEAVFNALRNLVENALVHTPAGTTVTIRVEAPSRIHVEDLGPGVPEELREHIFQRFWQAERRKSGSGLGLSIVRQIMEAHGGKVQVADRPGGGSIFTLEFPSEGAQRR